jgi:energy-coupling factor transporter ATPase
MNPLITLDGVRYRYPQDGSAARLALANVSLAFEEGEFIAILGANGSGKTTLARHLNGLLIPLQGSVRVGGLDTRERVNLGAIRQRVGMVFQHPEDQIVSATVAEDVAFGPENLGLPSAEIHRRVDEAIQAVGLEAHRDRPPHLLSAGQVQRLALAGVLAMRPRCVIFDEATTMLDPAGRRMALELMASLRAEGMVVIFVTHNMQEAALAGRCVVLNQGRVVFDGSPRALFSRPELAEWGLELPPAAQLAVALSQVLPGVESRALTIQELLDSLPLRQPACTPPPAVARRRVGTNEEAVISVEGLAHTYLAGTPLAHEALVGVDLRVTGGRAHGLVGVTGSGKSTLLQHLNGLLRPQAGRVRVGPYDLGDPQLPTRTVTRLAGLVMQNPEMQFFEQYVGDEIAYGPRQGVLDEPLAQRVRWAMQQVGLDFEAFKDRLTDTLSGGEKRKVALASILAIKPRILLLDEPTAGLDPRSRSEVIDALKMLAHQGMELVFSSHQMEDVAELAVDVTAFRKGRTVETGAAGDVFWDQARLEQIGLEAPVAAQAGTRLRQLGWPVMPGTLTAGELVRAVRECLEAAA